MGSTGAPDSTVGAITDADTTDAALKGTRDSSTAASEIAITALKGTRDSSTAVSEIAIAALKGTEGSSTVVPEMAIAAFTAEGISVEAPADSTAAMVGMGVAEATAEGTGSFPAFSI